MTIQKSKDKPLQFDSNLEKIIIRTFEKRSKNSSCERAVLYLIYRSRNLAHSCSYYLQRFIFTYGQKIKSFCSFKTRNLFKKNLFKNVVILQK
jgi:hypothetical protein